MKCFYKIEYKKSIIIWFYYRIVQISNDNNYASFKLEFIILYDFENLNKLQWYSREKSG